MNEARHAISDKVELVMQYDEDRILFKTVPRKAIGKALVKERIAFDSSVSEVSKVSFAPGAMGCTVTLVRAGGDEKRLAIGDEDGEIAQALKRLFAGKAPVTREAVSAASKMMGLVLLGLGSFFLAVLFHFLVGVDPSSAPMRHRGKAAVFSFVAKAIGNTGVAIVFWGLIVLGVLFIIGGVVRALQGGDAPKKLGANLEWEDA